MLFRGMKKKKNNINIENKMNREKKRNIKKREREGEKL